MTEIYYIVRSTTNLNSFTYETLSKNKVDVFAQTTIAPIHYFLLNSFIEHIT